VAKSRAEHCAPYGVAMAQCGSASARLHRLITQNGAARSVKLVTGSVAMAKSGLAVARSQLLYQ
jgi:hypothetical protein